VVAEALLAALVQLQAGAAFQPGVIPAQTATAVVAANGSTSNTLLAAQGLGHTAATGTASAANTGSRITPASGTASGTALLTAHSNATSAAVTDFSLGSDAVSSSWRAGGPVDVASLTKLVLVVLRVLQRMERWHSVMSIGKEHSAELLFLVSSFGCKGAFNTALVCFLEALLYVGHSLFDDSDQKNPPGITAVLNLIAGRRWLEVCQGSADAVLLPMLLAVASKPGFAAEAAVLAPAYQAYMRDKNAAFDALEKASVKLRTQHQCPQPVLVSACNACQLQLLCLACFGYSTAL
jgi:hypothetical protein